MKKLTLLLGLLLVSNLSHAAYTQSGMLPHQYVDASDDPYSGATLCSYQAGTTTPQAFYSDNAGSGSVTSVALDSNGIPDGYPVLWLDNTLTYKFSIISAGTCASGLSYLGLSITSYPPVRATPPLTVIFQ